MFSTQFNRFESACVYAQAFVHSATMPPKVRSGAAADEDEQVSKSSYRDFVLPQLKTMDNHDELVVFRSCVKHLLVATPIMKKKT